MLTPFSLSYPFFRTLEDVAQVVKFFLNARSLRVRFCVDKSLDLVHVQILLHVIGVALEGVLEGEVGVKRGRKDR